MVEFEIRFLAFEDLVNELVKNLDTFEDPEVDCVKSRD
jgi:hypothetical protein